MSKATAKRKRSSHPMAIGKLTDQPRRFSASYDAAQTNSGNENHWAAADALSADAANSASVRAVLRQRARYEYSNNSFCHGMLLTLANEVIGPGPTLQLLHDNRNAANVIERGFAAWAREIKLARKLRLARNTRARDGEVFFIFMHNPRLNHPVKLDLTVIEGDQVTTPTFKFKRDQPVDGIVLDRIGNPITYHVLKVHPGEINIFNVGRTYDYDSIAAKFVAHLFRSDRPGQHRGVPEITPALPLFALLRRFTLATVSAAESAASIGLFIKSQFPPDPEDDALIEPADVIDLPRDSAFVLPDGYDFSQFKSEHPSTTHVEFKKSVLNEIARCLTMPYNIAAADSSGYNYSSGQLDHQVFDRMCIVDRQELESDLLDPLLSMYLQEASMLAGFLPIPDADGSIDHEWFWSGRGHADPQKMSTSNEISLRSYTTSLAHVYAREGRDWEKELEQIAKERARMKELGIAPAARDANDHEQESEARDEETAEATA